MERYPVPAIRIVLFDLGNTLIYFDGDWRQVIRRSAEWLGEELSRCYGCSLKPGEFADIYLGILKSEYDRREVDLQERTSAWVIGKVIEYLDLPPINLDETRRLLAGFYSILQAHWRTESDTHSVLQTLRRLGYGLGLVSNAADDADVQVLIDQAEIRPYFDVILTSARAGVRKPHPQIFHAALADWNADPSEAVMVGDLLGADILGARNLNMRSVWITRRANVPHNQQYVGIVKPDVQIDTLLPLPDILSEWNQKASACSQNSINQKMD